jgi:hypothetical protein
MRVTAHSGTTFMLKPNKAKAAQCRKLALQEKNAADRERWFSMERFWLRQTEPDKITADSETEVVMI